MNPHMHSECFLDRPLDSARLMSRAVDTCCRRPDRAAQCLTFVVCDDDLVILRPVTITGLPAEPEPAEVAEVLSAVDDKLAEIGVGGPTLMVRGKPHERITDNDRELHQLLLDRYGGDQDRPLRLLGFYVAGPTTVRRMPDPPLVPV
ncbi:hypothetical protein ABLG96_13555 [Nakamurella sp. A5-74]|uniref:Uncharacterized protein n=1 Tax=Nakamurella sp. A5-74 TaxID=3158264 RepID=A0AAU8DN27_9ACTN